MIYVLDTDILSLLAHQDSPEAPRIRRRIAELPPDDAVLITRNAADFRLVPDLRIEDWSIEA